MELFVKPLCRKKLQELKSGFRKPPKLNIRMFTFMMKTWMFLSKTEQFLRVLALMEQTVKNVLGLVATAKTELPLALPLR